MNYLRTMKQTQKTKVMEKLKINSKVEVILTEKAKTHLGIRSNPANPCKITGSYPKGHYFTDSTGHKFAVADKYEAITLMSE